jgi:hypothetical protein
LFKGIVARVGFGRKRCQDDASFVMTDLTSGTWLVHRGSEPPANVYIVLVSVGEFKFLREHPGRFRSLVSQSS